MLALTNSLFLFCILIFQIYLGLGFLFVMCFFVSFFSTFISIFLSVISIL